RASGARTTPAATPAVEPPSMSRTPRPSSASRRISGSKSTAPTAIVAPQASVAPQAPVAPPPHAVTPLPAPQAAKRQKENRSLAFVGTAVAVILASVAALGLVRQREGHTATGMRKLADHQYAAQHYEMARRFYVRALALDSTDALARRGLACASAK